MTELTVRMKNLCARRECCTSQIMEKLRRAGVTGGEADAVMAELHKGGWVDDARYAACYVREKSAVSGWGARKIAFQLRMKGIGADIIGSVLREAESEEGERRKRELLANKWREICRREEDEMKRKQKMFRFAAGRGYEASDVYELIS